MIVSRFMKKMKESQKITLPGPTYRECFLNTAMKPSEESLAVTTKIPTFQPKPVLTAWPHKAISVCLKNLYVI